MSEYRLLNEGEIIQEKDECYEVYLGNWMISPLLGVRIEEINFPHRRKIDTGWRWCKDELPNVLQDVVYDLDEDGCPLVAHRNSKGMWFNSETGMIVTVVQWCKLMPPLQEQPEGGER